MLIVGAKGLAKEVLEIFHKQGSVSSLYFYDDISKDVKTHLYDKFPILTSEDQARDYFSSKGQEFTLGVGVPFVRKSLYEKISKVGGKLTTVISSNSSIGSYGTIIEDGCNIMQKVGITNDIFIGKGTLVNQMSSICHDVHIEEFCEICPSVTISGHCYIGRESFIGTGAIILPGVKIGCRVVVGAGAVVTKDLPDDCVAVGVPAKIIDRREE